MLFCFGCAAFGSLRFDDEKKLVENRVEVPQVEKRNVEETITDRLKLHELAYDK